MQKKIIHTEIRCFELEQPSFFGPLIKEPFGPLIRAPFGPLIEEPLDL